MNIEIGHKFKTRGKYPKDVTVVDIHDIVSRKTGQIVKTIYIGTHESMGQTLTTEYLKTSVIMGSTNFKTNTSGE